MRARAPIRGIRRSGELDDAADVLHGWIANGGPCPVATFEATKEFHYSLILIQFVGRFRMLREARPGLG